VELDDDEDEDEPVVDDDDEPMDRPSYASAP
jgi:hypothetical protein